MTERVVPPGTAGDASVPPRPAPAERLLRTRLKLRHLNLIVALDDHRKLQRAAEEMNLSQPAASKMLGEIEKIVGVPLFERLARGVEPTPYGEALIRRTRTMLSELGQAGEEIAALSAGQGGTVAIGTVMAPAVDAVVESVRAVRRRMPRLQVSVDIETSDVLVERLLASRLDFAIARIPAGLDPAPLEYREIGPEQACLMVRAEHPLAARSRVSAQDLADQEWVLQPRGSLLRRSLEAMLRRHGLPAPTRVLNTGSILMTLVMAAKTDAIAPLAIPVAELFLKAGAFRILQLDEPLSVEPFGLVTVRGRPLSPPAQVMYAAVEQHLLGAVARDGLPGPDQEFGIGGGIRSVPR
ncbi:LysR family transcriptional regulator [Arenibaculum pallidiluteum]|uniref:LysR family transcriptional regulator n=1 Tax=Arenibaculum pallidiluteum TaxID=2812559 RepID=UPI001A95E23D|nr:LysR family transcriptional regulator [Arenibaculum pallidiluteum]